MATSTTRMALTKPSGSASPAEAVDVGVLNTNADLLDKFAPCILVNDGVTPATSDLYDGALVKEKTSGKIWEARKNGGGTFDKVWVRYPYLFVATTAATAMGTGTTLGNWGWSTYSSGKNSSSAEINGSNFWVCPVKGIYKVTSVIQYAASAVGQRAVVGRLNGTNQLTDTLVVASNQNTYEVTSYWHLTRVFAVSDIVGQQAWQNSGGNLNVSTAVQIEMVEPVQ